jgi:hypothetical protein
MTMMKAWAALGVVASYLLATAAAHEHHEDKIEEGHAVSADPIVGCGQAKIVLSGC